MRRPKLHTLTRTARGRSPGSRRSALATEAEVRAPSRARLSYYSFDSLGNPWIAGGAAMRDWEVMKQFARHADVTLVVGKYPDFQSATRDGVRIRGLGRGRSHVMSRLTFIIAANLCVPVDRADIIGNSISPYAPILTGILRRRRFYGVYHHIAGVYSRDRHGALGFVVWGIEQILLRSGRHYIASNTTVSRDLEALNYRARVFTTSNAFDPDLLEREPRATTPAFILFVGRFDVHMKGLDVLMRAYTEVASATGVDLVLAGRASPSVAESVRSLIPVALKSRVRMELNISDDRKADLLSSCLFFCSPSRIEGFGIAALEANAAGKAVLATDVDGFRASLAFGETALAVPPSDSDALRVGMARLIEDSRLRESMGRRGRERARAFSWEAIAEAEWAWLAQLATG